MPPRPILGTIVLTISPYSGRSIYHACNQLRSLLPTSIPSLPYSSLHHIPILTRVPHTIEPFLRNLASETPPFRLHIELPLCRKEALFNGRKQPFYYRELAEEEARPGEEGQLGRLFRAFAGHLQLGTWEEGEAQWALVPKFGEKPGDGVKAVEGKEKAGMEGAMVDLKNFPILRLPLMKIKRALDREEEDVVRDVLEIGGERLIDAIGLVEVVGVSWIPGPGAKKITSKLNEMFEQGNMHTASKDHWRIIGKQRERAAGRNTNLEANSRAEINKKTTVNISNSQNQDHERREEKTKTTPPPPPRLNQATPSLPSADKEEDASATFALQPTAEVSRIAVRQIYHPLTGNQPPPPPPPPAAQQVGPKEDARSLMARKWAEERKRRIASGEYFRLTAEEADLYDEYYTPSRDARVVRRESEGEGEMQSLEEAIREALEKRASLGAGIQRMLRRGGRGR